jgi:phytoene desaturase
MQSAIVIGAGIGGIAIAARLARNGFNVTVFEKNSTPGGRFNKIERNGFRFDTGPTLFLMPEIFAETYNSLGERMEDHLDLIRLDPTYRVHLHDKTTIDLTADLNDMRVQLDAIEHGSFEAYLRFLSEGYRHYYLSLKHFVGRNFITPFEFFSPKNIPLIFSLKALTTHYKNVSKYFHDPRLQAVFSFQNMYLGLSPYEALATYSLLQYTELAEGVWFPKGGMYKTVETLVAIAEGLGVKFNYNTPVSKINVDGLKVSGITLADGTVIKADLAIANADLPYVYSKLLPDNAISKKLEKRKYTSSALMFYWSIKGDRSQQLIHHNVFLADHRYKESFTNIFHDLTLPEEPSFYVCAPTRTDPSFAPPDGDSLLVLVPVGHINNQNLQDWNSIKQRAKEFVLLKLSELGIENLSSKIIFEETVGPLDYLNSMNLAKGSAFGLSHNFTQVGYLRPHNRHSRYKNLYFVGASTHPGTGVPIVLISARLVMERILSEKW